MADDPTKTIVLRARAAREVARRFGRVRRAVRSAISPGGLLTNIRMATPGEFQFVRDDRKLPEFEEFLRQQIDDEILRIEGSGAVRDHWLNAHVGDGYNRGARKTRLAAERAMPAMNKLPDYVPLANPFHIERAELIFQRVFSDLEGVTTAMSKQVSRVLSDGILNGEQPKKVAKKMAERVDKIGITRAKLIARTEIIESHNTAAIKEADILETETGEKIMMQWITALDGRQRDSHEDRHKQIYTRKRAQELIGEPNCRCSVSAYFDL